TLSTDPPSSRRGRCVRRAAAGRAPATVLSASRPIAFPARPHHPVHCDGGRGGCCPRPDRGSSSSSFSPDSMKAAPFRGRQVAMGGPAFGKRQAGKGAAPPAELAQHTCCHAVGKAKQRRAPGDEAPEAQARAIACWSQMAFEFLLAPEAHH